MIAQKLYKNLLEKATLYESIAGQDVMLSGGGRREKC
jgi:hypothetical protein